jgi:hypothetical protein
MTEFEVNDRVWIGRNFRGTVIAVLNRYPPLMYRVKIDAPGSPTGCYTPRQLKHQDVVDRLAHLVDEED